MFNDIAPTYDTLNHILSLGIDRSWRRHALEALAPHRPGRVLDVATGTGDFALLAASILHPHKIIGTDISEGMMTIARQKTATQGLTKLITFQREDSLALSFPDDSFDAVTVAYGLRNFQDLDKGLRELHRVIKPGGHLLALELATPRRFPMRQLFWLYAHTLMPLLGWLKSRNRGAYEYLGGTMATFPQGDALQLILERNGFGRVEWHTFPFGVCTYYLAWKHTDL